MCFLPPIGLMRQPFGGAPAGPNLLADFNFSAPLAQSFPTTAAGLADELGDAAALASYIFPCQELSGNLVDTVAGKDLAVTTGTPLWGRTAIGLWDGASMTSRKAVEFTLPAAVDFVATDSAIMQPDAATSSAYLFSFRGRRNAGALSLLGKGIAAGNLGIHIWLGGATGKLTAQLNDGANNVQVIGNGDDATTAHCAGLVVINRTTDMMYIYSSSGLVASGSIAAVGDASNARGLYLGRGRFGAGANQIQYLACFEGAAAEALGQNELDAWWRHGKDPTGLLTTTSRNSAISVPLSAGTVGHFAGGTTLGTCQLPIGYNANFTDTDKLGLYCNSAVTNLIPYSRLSTGAVVSNVTATDNAADAADGFRAATTIAATAANGYLGKAATVTASTAYCGSVYIKESTVGVAGRVYAYDATNLAEIAGSSKPYTATATPQDIQCPFTTPAGCTSVQLRVEITTSGQTVIADFWQVNTGGARGAIINTNGAAAALVASNYKAAGSLIQIQVGEVETVSVNCLQTTSLNTIVDTDSGSTDQRSIYVNNLGNLVGTLRGGGTFEDSAVSLQTNIDTEVTSRYLWDVAAESLGFECVLVTNGTTKNGSALPYEAAHGAGFTGIGIGCPSAPGTQNFDGFIQSVKSYDAANGAIP